MLMKYAAPSEASVHMNACRDQNNCHICCQARTAPEVTGCHQTAEHPLLDQDIQSCSPLVLTQNFMLAFPPLHCPCPDTSGHSRPEKCRRCHHLSSKLFRGYGQCKKMSQRNDSCPKGVPKVFSETSQEKGWVALLHISKGAL